MEWKAITAEIHKKSQLKENHNHLIITRIIYYMIDQSFN